MPSANCWQKLDHPLRCAHSGTTVQLNDSGYMDDRLSMSYIKHFDEFTKDHAVGKWRMLISDDHGSHEHYDFIEYCWKHYIIPYPLPPHTTHLMQPLDVAC